MKEDLSEYRQVVVFADNKLAEQDQDVSVIDGLLEKLEAKE